MAIDMASVDVLHRFRAGDADAVRALYREYAGAVMTVAVSIVHDRDLAADVVQQTFVKAWRSAGTFHGDREFAPWLYAIARNTAIDVVRADARAGRRGDLVRLDAVGEPAVDGASLEQLWEGHEVRRAVDALPPDEREVVRRSHLLGQTHDEIASELGVPIGTVKSRSNRAHRRLAASLAHVGANRGGRGDVVEAEAER